MFRVGLSLFESDLLLSLPIQGSGYHEQTPLVEYLPNVQSTWLEEILESPDKEVVVKKGLHWQPFSNSVAFLTCLEHVLICI